MLITIPIAPKPQSRPRFNGKTKRAYEKSDMTSYKRLLAGCVRRCKPHYHESGPVSVTACFYVYPPGIIRNPKKNQLSLLEESIYCDKKPDLDNYYKAVTDAIEGIVYKNDGQIAEMIGRKFYSLSPRTKIEIRSLREEQTQPKTSSAVS